VKAIDVVLSLSSPFLIGLLPDWTAELSHSDWTSDWPLGEREGERRRRRRRREMFQNFDNLFVLNQKNVLG